MGVVDVIPDDLMLFDGRLVGTAAVFGRYGGGEVPFYIAGSADEGDVIEINYLQPLSASDIHR